MRKITSHSFHSTLELVVRGVAQLLLHGSKGALAHHGWLVPILGGEAVTKQLQAAVRTADKQSKLSLQLPYTEGHRKNLHNIRKMGKIALESEQNCVGIGHWGQEV